MGLRERDRERESERVSERERDRGRRICDGDGIVASETSPAEARCVARSPLLFAYRVCVCVCVCVRVFVCVYVCVVGVCMYIDIWIY